MRASIAIILTVLVCASAIFSSGCGEPAVVVGGAAAAMAVTAVSHPVTEGAVVSVADTNAERRQRLKDAHNIGWRQFVDDWDAFWLQDRSSRLSEYPIR